MTGGGRDARPLRRGGVPVADPRQPTAGQPFFVSPYRRAGLIRPREPGIHVAAASPSSSGLGHRPLTPKTGVRVP